jgi:phosphatidylglycerol:prolipoprotein diacylglycerol transferase
LISDVFELASSKMTSVGVLLACGFGIGLWLVRRRARQAGVPNSIVTETALIALVFGIVGAKLFYALFHWPEVSANVTHFLSSGLEGSGVYGAVFLAVPVAIGYLRLRSQPVWKSLDLFAPSLAFLFAIGRLGCFSMGCCFGKPVHSSLGVVFSASSPAGCAFPDQALVPTQLFECLGGLSILAIVLLIEKKARLVPGRSFLMVLFLYGVVRFIIDFYRYYEDSMIVASAYGYRMPATQLFSMFLISATLSIIAYGGFRNRSVTENSKRGLDHPSVEAEVITPSRKKD